MQISVANANRGLAYFWIAIQRGKKTKSQID